MSQTDKRKKEDLKVFISNRDSKCDECGEYLGPRAWIVLRGDKGGNMEIPKLLP